MTMKFINTAAAGGLLYTNAFSASLGDTAYAPGDVDSQELDVLEESNDKSIKDMLDLHKHVPKWRDELPIKQRFPPRRQSTLIHN